MLVWSNVSLFLRHILYGYLCYQNWFMSKLLCQPGDCFFPHFRRVFMPDVGIKQAAEMIRLIIKLVKMFLKGVDNMHAIDRRTAIQLACHCQVGPRSD